MAKGSAFHWQGVLVEKWVRLEKQHFGDRAVAFSVF
jgi:hypothetical protein